MSQRLEQLILNLIPQKILFVIERKVKYALGPVFLADSSFSPKAAPLPVPSSIAGPTISVKPRLYFPETWLWRLENRYHVVCVSGGYSSTVSCCHIRSDGCLHHLGFVMLAIILVLAWTGYVYLI